MITRLDFPEPRPHAERHAELQGREREEYEAAPGPVGLLAPQTQAEGHGGDDRGECEDALPQSVAEHTLFGAPRWLPEDVRVGGFGADRHAGEAVGEQIDPRILLTLFIGLTMFALGVAGGDYRMRSPRFLVAEFRSRAPLPGHKRGGTPPMTTARDRKGDRVDVPFLHRPYAQYSLSMMPGGSRRPVGRDDRALLMTRCTAASTAGTRSASRCPWLTAGTPAADGAAESDAWQKWLDGVSA